jgi:exopolyphosphatase/guanosine-5'-triphosphate,3'-diphosphate pyrophosphatase
MSDGQVVAALDIGSNTVRLLVAEPKGGGITPVLDDSEFVRLGRGVDGTGALDPERMDAALSAISRLAKEAREAGAGEIVAIATSAVRDARNGEAFARRVRDETGIDVQIISGNRESELTYLGATLGLEIQSGAIICDLGGGSAELIAADASGMQWEQSVQLGSGRLTERFVQHDPPQPDELDAVAACVDEVLRGLPSAQVETAIFTGGTATHLAFLARVEGSPVSLDLDTVRQVVDTLLTHTAAEIVAQYNIKPERAQVLPAGVRAVQAIAEHYGVEPITITRSGIREGALIDLLSTKGARPGS